MSFAKDGNSDIYSMDLETRVVEQITNILLLIHHLLIHQMVNI